MMRNKVEHVRFMTRNKLEHVRFMTRNKLEHVRFMTRNKLEHVRFVTRNKLKHVRFMTRNELEHVRFLCRITRASNVNCAGRCWAGPAIWPRTWTCTEVQGSIIYTKIIFYKGPDSLNLVFLRTRLIKM